MTIQLNDQAIALMNQLAGMLSANSDGPWVKENVQIIYTNPQHPNGLWSMRGEKEKEFIDCPSDRLRGRISRLWHTEKEPGKIRWYLRLECPDNLSFIIQSSHDRGFSRSMLAAIAMMSVEEVKSEVVIQCTGWEAKNGPMQFCTIYTGDRKLDSPKVESEHIGAIARTAQAVVAEACGYEYNPGKQTEPTSSGGQIPPDCDDIPF